MLHLIFILIFFIVILNVLGKIARSAKKLQPREKTSGGGLLDSIGKAFNASARNEAWMKAAGDLGLSFVRPSTVYDTPSIAGRIEGFEISVFTEHDPDKTIYRITFPKNIDIGFLAMRDEAVTMLNRQFSGRKRLDKILNLLPDDLVNSAVSAYEEKALNRFLTKERRDALLRCLRLYENVKIDDNSLAVTYNGIEGNPEKLCARINTALMFARIFGCDTEPLPTPPSAAAHSNDIRNPEAIKAEPKAIKAEPKAIKAEPKAIKAEPKAIKAEPEAIKAEPEDALSPPAPAHSRNPDETSDNELLKKEALLPALFASTFVGTREKELFELVRGKEVVWDGLLKGEYEFGMDFAFGSQGGVKATLELLEIRQGAYSMKAKVKGIVCFPKSELQTLRALNGERITFRGTLLKFEGFAREVYLTSGALMQEGTQP